MKVGRVVLVGALICVGTMLLAQDKKTNGGNVAQLSRGKYLVERVGMCADCHSPRNERGEFVKDKWLAGSPLMFKPAFPVPGWVDVAPGIAGLPGWNEKDAISFLTTGKGLNGKVTGPPMPEFRFTQADAAAVVAYLKSLKSQPVSTKATPSPQKTKKAAASPAL